MLTHKGTVTVASFVVAPDDGGEGAGTGVVDEAVEFKLMELNAGNVVKGTSSVVKACTCELLATLLAASITPVVTLKWLAMSAKDSCGRTTYVSNTVVPLFVF